MSWLALSEYLVNGFVMGTLYVLMAIGLSLIFGMIGVINFAHGILFTLGGGYDVHSVPRVWALLYLTVHGLPVASDLPAEWRQRWQERLGVELPAAMHDPNPPFAPVPQREEIAAYNRRVTDRLLDSMMPYWYGSV
jgi:hypothetical protein